jgi:hypothetical protein
MKLSQPWSDPYKINARSPYGWRRHPITGKRTFHHGVDVAMPVGSPLTAPADGVIVHKGNGGSGGVTLIVQHANDLFTVYYHLQKPSHLNKGDRVLEGDLIAFSGNTGASTGPHLHFEVRTPSRRWGQTVDPVPYLQGAPSVEPAPLKVDGKLGRNTWKAFQTALKNAGYYKGVPDGRPGIMTTRAVQEWAGATVDGRMGPQTRRKVQERLGVKPDGVWGRITVSELQRQLNQGRIG